MDVFKAGNLSLGFFQVQASGIVTVEFFDGGTFCVSVLEVLVTVEVSVIGRNTVKVAHIFGLGALFLGKESFVHLLSMTDSDDFDVFFLASEEFADSFGLGLVGTGGSFLDDEAGHLGLGEGDRVALANLVNPEGNQRGWAWGLVSAYQPRALSDIRGLPGAFLLLTVLSLFYA